MDADDLMFWAQEFVNPVAFGWTGVMPPALPQHVYVNAMGEMMWDVGPPNRLQFRVTRYANALWGCNCPYGVVQGSPMNVCQEMCDHMQAAYLHWLNTENTRAQAHFLPAATERIVVVQKPKEPELDRSEPNFMEPPRRKIKLGDD